MSLITPGTTVTVGTAPAPGASATSTGQAFVAGLTERGPVGVPILLQSLNDYVALLGSRVSYGELYDFAEMFFAIGGTTMWVSREVGPAALPASVTLKDSAAANTIVVSSIGPGVAGNSLTVAVVAGAITGTYQIQVLNAGVEVETSPLLMTQADAINWGTLNPASTSTNASKWVSITASSPTSGLAPAVVAATALTGGADDNSNVSDSTVTAALAVFAPDMGPGQLAVPGRTTSGTYSAMGASAASSNRLAVCDLAPGQTATEISTATAAAQTALINSGIDPSYTTFVGPEITWPGISTGTPVPSWPRQIPASAAFCGLAARNDAANDANQAFAGTANGGVVPGALGVTQSFDTTDRATINAAGVCLFRVINGVVALYGFQSLAQNPSWTDLANVRFRMQLTNDALLIGNSFDFAQIDGAGHTIAAFNGALSANLLGYYNAGSLYGAKPADAFTVSTGPSVNTPATIADRQLRAIEAVVMSPSAEAVEIQIVKYQVGQVIPASS